MFQTILDIHRLIWPGTLPHQLASRGTYESGLLTNSEHFLDDFLNSCVFVSFGLQKGFKMIDLTQ